MQGTKFQFVAGLALGLAILLSSACSINVKKQKDGQDKQVDINTVVGGIHVNKKVNPEDVGIAIYPGSRLKPENFNGESKSADVDISGFGYGLKVVALEYESDDAPNKVLDYYKDQLKKYGDVLVCHTNHLNVNADVKELNKGSNQLTCEGSVGVNVELKVGAKDNQHIVAVQPQGKGSSFSLVYVRTHGKDSEI